MSILPDINLCANEFIFDSFPDSFSSERIASLDVSLSSSFISNFIRHGQQQHHFTNFTEAIDAVKRGEMWGVLHIKDRFSLNLQRR